MTLDPATRDKNREELRRLEELVESNPDYLADLGGGWTVAVAFAHLAFWDRRQATLLRDWSLGDPLPVSATDDQLNPVLEPLWQEMRPESTGPMAVEAAREVTELVENLPQEKIDALVDLGMTFMRARGNHREDHVDQILRGLGRPV